MRQEKRKKKKGTITLGVKTGCRDFLILLNIMYSLTPMKVRSQTHGGH
jgi:hypothetical protein